MLNCSWAQLDCNCKALQLVLTSAAGTCHGCTFVVVMQIHPEDAFGQQMMRNLEVQQTASTHHCQMHESCIELWVMRESSMYLCKQCIYPQSVIVHQVTHIIKAGPTTLLPIQGQYCYVACFTLWSFSGLGLVQTSSILCGHISLCYIRPEVTKR